MQNNNAAKFAFFYMLSLVALIFMSLSSGMIIFQIINKKIIDVLASRYNNGFSTEQLKFAISSILISAPIFYITTKLIHKNLFLGHLKQDSGIRKWLTYLILFISSVVMIGWLIAIVNSFLGGELTLKFILKALTAIGISGAIFSFYLYDIKREEVVNKKDKTLKIYFISSLIVVIAIFTSALFFVESPTETRNRKADNLALNKFDEISNAINEYHNENNKLPENLTTLKDEFSYITEITLKDSLTEKLFVYEKVNETSYKLCSDFRTSNLEETDFYNKQWPHESGYQCLNSKARIDKLMPIRF